MIYVPIGHSQIAKSKLRGVCLIGDDLQLPPITTFTQMGINSLTFIMQHTNFFVQTLPQSRIITLIEQHRMHPAIRQLSQIFTPGRVLIDSLATYRASNLLQNFTSSYPPNLLAPTITFLNEILDPMKTVIILNTSLIDSIGSNIRIGTSRKNDIELRLIQKLLKCIQTAYSTYNFNKSETLKIISPYTAQAEELSLFYDYANTVDAFQGQEALMVITSLTFNDQSSSKHLTDDKRLHVMMSRAKSKIIIIGHKDTLVNQGRFCDVFTFHYSNNPVLGYDPVLICDIDPIIFSDLQNIP
jgi:regulator of nonsense transcripts 1